MLSPQLAESVGGIHTPRDLLKLRIIDPGDPWWAHWFAAAGVHDADRASRPASRLGAQSFEARPAIAGQGVMLAWQTLAGYSVIEGRLVVPFPVRVKTGFGHYFVKPPSRRETRTVTAFKQWVREEIEDSMQKLGFA